MIGLEGAPLEVIGGLVDPTVLLSRAQKALELQSPHLKFVISALMNKVTNN